MATHRSNRRARRPLAFALLVALVPAACAYGSGEGIGDDYADPPDARVDTPPGPVIDARVDASFIDATDAPILPPDAPGGGTCTTHAECGAGMCCFGMAMCIPGMAIPGFPPPFDCFPA